MAIAVVVAHLNEVGSVLGVIVQLWASKLISQRLLEVPERAGLGSCFVCSKRSPTSLRLPVVSLRTSNPPGPMLLLRDFFRDALGASANVVESTVLFSLFTVSGEGICAIDLRDRGRCVFTGGFSIIAVAYEVSFRLVLGKVTRALKERAPC